MLGNIVMTESDRVLMSHVPPSYTAFAGDELLSRGAAHEVAIAMKRLVEADPTRPVLVFEDATGQQVDFDLRGSEADVVTRLAAAVSPGEVDGRARGRGRPKLGVTAREVTLLPRHWDWLNAQPGGASVTLRKLVDEARRRESDDGRAARNAAYAFMAAMAGDLPGFEEATRALFADDRTRFSVLVAGWPKDVKQHAARLAFGREDGAPAPSLTDPGF